MKVTVSGRLLQIRSGVSKKTGKSFCVGSVFDGDDLIKVYGVDPNLPLECDVSIPCRLDITGDSVFFMALK